MASSYLELTREPDGDDHLDQVETALDRMETIIDDMLTIAREGQTLRERNRRGSLRVHRRSVTATARSVRPCTGRPWRIPRPLRRLSKASPSC
ncbi:hypothetical protein ACOZ4I_17415 (plasmid) [Haloarcula salina]|uniref:hypothetical protein n=1 Tax=Haloarcula salina TaxID=1429914 RepID=UPI003C6FFE8B